MSENRKSGDRVLDESLGAAWDISNSRWADSIIVANHLSAQSRKVIRAKLSTRLGDASEHEPDLLSAYEAAALLNISPSTLRDWASKGRGPRVYRLGPRQFRWDRRDLLLFLRSRRSDGGT